MARQISVSDGVYLELTRLKGSKSFSEIIKEMIGIKEGNEKILLE